MVLLLWGILRDDVKRLLALTLAAESSHYFFINIPPRCARVRARSAMAQRAHHPAVLTMIRDA